MHSVWLAARIAWRYLVSKKKHGAVGVITWISVVGVAVATAATICVLSVFNGFQQVLAQRLETLSPEVEITPEKGRTFAADTTWINRITALREVAAICQVVSDRALAIYQGQEMPVHILGVETVIFRRHSALDSLLVAGSDTFVPIAAQSEPLTDDTEFSEEAILAEELGADSLPRCVVSAGVGMRLAIPPSESGNITLIAPRREGVINMANPAASLQMLDADVEGVFQSLQSDFDKDFVIMPLQATRTLLQTDEPLLSSLYVYGTSTVTPEQLARIINPLLPSGIIAKERLRQHESQFRMANIEKWITFLLLSFILLISSFNLISSLAMLVIDKQENLAVLHALGATRTRIATIFAWESGFVTLLGALAGMVLGIILTLLQQYFGLIRLNADPGTLIVTAYPAQLEWGDLLVVAIPLTVIGLITALLTARFARTRF